MFLEQSSDEPHLKLLAAPYNRGQQQLEQHDSLEGMPTQTTGRQFYKYGVWHSPAEFLEKAQQVKRPVDADNFLHGATKAAIGLSTLTSLLSLNKGWQLSSTSGGCILKWLQKKQSFDKACVNM